ncbi:MAG: DUF4837 family protein [Prolixibacteraceae bacterium]|nr:DUF4837 family protein [Prolixibacteraceae bacterium]MBN2774176.1 DUF4837 family protein [Prolixibacteraceae bacterium]
MRNFILKSVIIALVVFTAVSCGENTSQGISKSITGRPGEMVIVITKDDWESAPGKLLQETLGQPQLSLPQEEPIFNLVDIPHNAFDNIFKTTRNIITTKISTTVEESGVFFKDNVWARPQATVTINAKNAEQFQELVNENSGKIISYFLKAERSRLQATYKNIHDKAMLKNLQDKFGITMYCQPGFKKAVETDDFIWFRYDTPEITQGIFVYEIKYNSDSIFSPEYLLYKRNLFLKHNVAGPTEGSYMSTNMLIDPVFNIFEHNGNYTAEMRGLWRTENDFMGGPYIEIAELDASNQRVIVAEGFVYAPSKDKRNLLRQMEAMIYSMKFDNQAENDKINSEIKMGN